jgi:hypothetical protein
MVINQHFAIDNLVKVQFNINFRFLIKFIKKIFQKIGLFNRYNLNLLLLISYYYFISLKQFFLLNLIKLILAFILSNRNFIKLYLLIKNFSI